MTNIKCNKASDRNHSALRTSKQYEQNKMTDGFNILKENNKIVLKVLAMIPYFNFHFFPHLLIFLKIRDPSYVLNL